MKTQIRYTLCYQTVTPESAEEGDFAEHGFCDEHGNRFPWPGDRPTQDASKQFKEDNTLTADGIRALVYVAEQLGIQYHGDAAWAHSYGDEVSDYSTGERIEYSLHVEHDRHHYHVMRMLAVKPCARPSEREACTACGESHPARPGECDRAND